MANPGDIFRKITGKEIPETIEEVDRIVAEHRGLKELPISDCSSSLAPSRTTFALKDYPISDIDRQLDLFLKD